MSIKKGRHVGIELLRILSMMFVVNLHFMIKGQYSKTSDNFVNIESWIIICFSIVAVNSYVLITGYFMTDKSFKLSRVTNTYIQVFFYSVLTFVIVSLLGIQSFSFGQAFTAVTPFIHNSYWFANSYLLLLLFTPLLNTAIQHLEKPKFQLILLVLVFTYSVFNNAVKLINPIDKTAGYGVLWFIVLYLTAGYLKKYYSPSGKPLKYFLLYLLTVLINFVFHSIFGGLGEVWNNGMVRDYNNILVYFGAVFIFLAFLNVNIKRNLLRKIILFFSPLTFAVYLIHESPFISGWLWQTININTWCVNDPLFIIFAFGTVICLFLVLSIVEFVRVLIFKYCKINNLITMFSNFIESKIRILVISRSKK